MNHETFHGLGLYHTHQEKDINGNLIAINEPNRMFVYPNYLDLLPIDKPKATDNVMSYNSVAITLWNWQIKLAGPNI